MTTIVGMRASKIGLEVIEDTGCEEAGTLDLEISPDWVNVSVISKVVVVM